MQRTARGPMPRLACSCLAALESTPASYFALAVHCSISGLYRRGFHEVNLHRRLTCGQVQRLKKRTSDLLLTTNETQPIGHGVVLALSPITVPLHPLRTPTSLQGDADRREAAQANQGRANFRRAAPLPFQARCLKCSSTCAQW